MRIVLLCALLSLVPLFAMDNLPECYHTYDEITEILFQLEESYPNIAKVHMIGYSQEENLPIYAMQISANVEATWERPALLFVGQVHAEEVLGVEITLSNIQEILNNQYQVPYSSWINQLDSWWIPTLNPEGHNVVTSNLDTSYRKNKRDNNNNGVFDFSSLVGYDIDGVDINRNFDFNWTHGDTLMQPGGTEVYDYYRGPSPMSESEIIAIKQLADAKKFIYSICWHSSRSGNFSEKVYYSFNWKDVRPSPDFAFAQSIAQGVASQIQKESAGTYEYYPNASRRGAFHDWMYKEYGTIQLLIEVGTRNLQPNEALMLDTIQRATNGVWWMMNRALRFSTNVASSSLLTGQFTDSVTGDPLQAELIIEQKHAPWFVARTSFADTGRYWKALPQGSYTLRVRKEGYWDKVLEYVNVNNSSWTTRNIALDPKETTLMHGYVTSSGTNIPAQMIIKDISPDTLSFEGHYIYHGYEGEYPIEIFSDGYYPYLGTLTLEPGTVQQSYNLSPATTLFSETWENGSDAWTNSGEWVLQNELSSSGYAITDSWGGRGHYAQNCDVHIATVNPIALPIAGNPLLYFDSHLYTEWDHDPVTVEISLDNESWTELWTKSGRHDFWQREYIDLSEYAGNEVYLRFRLRDSSIADELTDPGWTIDNIYVITGVATSLIDQLIPGIEKSVLYPNFPNPFNPETTIRYSLAASSKVELDIFNIRGQKVRSYHPGMQAAGNYRFIFDGMDDAGQSLASGIYFYRMKTGDLVQSRKMILMK
ncbi:MAG: M14 family zinc carboxypeptidase [Candidatus Cloacimonetes bacterium]|nr:M14 family zinc carboxypeptidase [Candidatus Cloacimonadota bacterium]